MDPGEQVSDSPQGWVARHIRRYVDSEGAKGHEWFAFVQPWLGR